MVLILSSLKISFLKYSLNSIEVAAFSEAQYTLTASSAKNEGICHTMHNPPK